MSCVAGFVVVLIDSLCIDGPTASLAAAFAGECYCISVIVVCYINISCNYMHVCHPFIIKLSTCVTRVL